MKPGDTVRRAQRHSMAYCAALALVLVLAATAEACPMCKVALASDDGAHGDVIGGFFWSILFMLSMPFTILGTFSGYMYLLVRRARAQQAAGQTTVNRTRQPAAPMAANADESSVVESHTRGAV